MLIGWGSLNVGARLRDRLRVQRLEALKQGDASRDRGQWDAALVAVGVDLRREIRRVRRGRRRNGTRQQLRDAPVMDAVAGQPLSVPRVGTPA